jgi:prepilin-type N-terminal cleavage/methylation domain-containing protein
MMPPKSKNGFTLTELVISMSLLGVLIGMMAVAYLQQSPKYRLKKAVWEIHSRLNYARYKSIYKGEKYRVKFEENGYTVEKFNESQGQWKHDLWNLCEGVFIEANNNPIFHPRGTVSNLASITISNSWGKYKISIAISGRIKITHLEGLPGN